VVAIVYDEASDVRMGKFLLVLLFAVLQGEIALQVDDCNEGILAVIPPSLSPGRLFTLTTAYPVQSINVSYQLSGEENFNNGYMCTLIETDSEACDNTTCVQWASCQDRAELLPDNAFVNLSLLLQLPSIPESEEESEEGSEEEDEEEASNKSPICYQSIQVFWNQNGELYKSYFLANNSMCLCGFQHTFESICSCLEPQPVTYTDPRQ